jgi:hypothetical protein
MRPICPPGSRSTKQPVSSPERPRGDQVTPSWIPPLGAIAVDNARGARQVGGFCRCHARVAGRLMVEAWRRPLIAVIAFRPRSSNTRSGSIYGRSQHGKGALQWSDNQSVAAIHPAFDAACAGLDEVRGSAPNYLGGHLRPDRANGFGRSRSDRLSSQLCSPSHCRD